VSRLIEVHQDHSPYKQSLPQVTSALAQVAAQSAPNSPPSVIRAMGNISAIVNMAQPTAVAAGAAAQHLASPHSSPCDCQCMCPSTGFQVGANTSIMEAIPEIQMSTLLTMMSTNSAGQASTQPMTAQSATTSAMVAQQANVAPSASTASSTPVVTAPAQMASLAVDPPAPPLVADTTTSMTQSGNMSSNSEAPMAPAFNINTYPLSSAVTAPVILQK